MIAESKTSALAITTWYVSLEIMLAARPVLGFTAQRCVRLGSKHQKAQTIAIQVLNDMRKVFLCFFVKVGYSNTSGEDSIIRVFRR